MEKNSEVIQTHPLVGWDISTVDSYDALMLRLHYQTPGNDSNLLIVFYVQIMPDDFVMQLHR
ncbi:hypothetical protein V7O28_08710, partial [Enterobacter hormaechei subsp. xiangfangensis]